MPPALAPGEASFSSHCSPSLPADQYSVTIGQTINTPARDPAEQEPANKKIEALAPEWALSAASKGDDETTSASEEGTEMVLSVFPASGQVAPSFRTLPHMVLRDAQLPWRRTVSKNTADELNAIPWFALVVFSADELELEAAERTAYFDGINGVNGTVNDTLGWDTTVDRIKDISSDRLANFIPEPVTPDVRPKTKTSLLAVKADAFKKLFLPKTDSTTKQTTFDVSQYRFMSHIRTVSSQGTPSADLVTGIHHNPKLAGTQTVSVVISHRIGPTDARTPTAVFAHLVSLQGIDGKDANILESKDHVLMASLFSWSYTALPPDAPDMVSMLQYLGTPGNSLAVLGTDMVNDPEIKYASKEEEAIAKRQKHGYKIVRYRVTTGEQTAAMYRGPLTPTRVPYPWNGKTAFQSNVGTDLQIFDPDVRLMDISYSSAWSLGRTLAMADPAFTTALTRLRMLVHQDAFSMTRSEVWETLRGTLDATEKEGSPGEAKASVFLDPKPQMPEQHDLFHTLDDANADDDKSPYNYNTVPRNTDYAVVQEWILNRLQLNSIPVHYFLPDPTHIPAETLRFFHIDSNWMDALVDGGLSLANHLASKPEEDCHRIALKAALNEHFKKPSLGEHRQQVVPSYGFILRSKLLAQFPNLAISAKFSEDTVHPNEDWDSVKPEPPILVQRRLGSDMMLVLMDREPPNLTKVTFTLSAHQQTFVAAHALSKDKVEIQRKRIYATGADPYLPEHGSEERRKPLDLDDPSPIATSQLFDWDARTLKVEEYAKDIHKNLEAKMRDMYREKGPKSAMFSLQLKEPSHTLSVTV